MRPPGPEPSSRASSTPSSRAIRRATGDAFTRPPLPLGARSFTAVPPPAAAAWASPFAWAPAGSRSACSAPASSALAGLGFVRSARVRFARVRSAPACSASPSAAPLSSAAGRSDFSPASLGSPIRAIGSPIASVSPSWATISISVPSVSAS